MKQRISILMVAGVFALAAMFVMFGCGGCRETAQPLAGPTDDDNGVEQGGSDPDLVTLERLEFLGLALDDYIDEHQVNPVADSVHELIVALQTYERNLNALDGWGREFQVGVVEGVFVVRSLGSDGLLDDGPPQGAVEGLERDIVWRDGWFDQWPAARSDFVD